MNVAPGTAPTQPAFELLRFSAVPAGEDVAVLELEGRFSSRAERDIGRPRLVVEDPSGAVTEALPVTGGDATAGPEASGWRAAYAVPLATVHTGDFALAVGRWLLLDLPAPDLEDAGGAAARRHVRLAREVNRLRRLGDEAVAGAAAAQERHDRVADGLEAERRRRERSEAERDAARDEAAALRTALEAEREHAAAAAEQAASEHRRRLDTARREGEEALERAGTESLQRLEEAVAAERARTLAARQEARALRAQLEALRRETPHLHPPRAPGGEEPAPRSTGEPRVRLATRRLEVPEPPTGEQVMPVTEERSTDPLPLDARATETVRVLSPRPRRPRRELAEEAAEANDALTPPELAQIGARHIERGTGARRGRELGLARHSHATRAIALAALAVIAIALAIIVLGP